MILSDRLHLKHWRAEVVQLLIQPGLYSSHQQLLFVVGVKLLHLPPPPFLSANKI